MGSGTAHRARKVVAFSLIFLSLLPLIVFSNFVSKGIVYAATSTKQSINDAQQKQDEINAQIDNIKKDIASVSKKKNKLSGSLSWLNDRSDEQRQLYEQKLEELDATMQALADSNEAYINAMNDLSNKKELYKKRLQAMFSYKRNSYLEWFLESGSLKNYFTMVQFMQIVAESDQQILDDLQASADDAELKKQNLEKQKSELSAITNNITLQIEKLKSDINTTQAQLQSIQDNLNSLNKEEDQLNAESQEIGQAIKLLQKKLTSDQNSQSLGINENGWVWPYPANNILFSPYGWRIHPILRYKKFHAGTDISGDYGKSIVAAKDGVVILVKNPVQGQNRGGSGYGNYVVIAHNGMVTSLYAHMKETLVKVGQVVKAGDLIGRCGSTGLSTGAHLHFEIRINGETTDPIPYVT